MTLVAGCASEIIPNNGAVYRNEAVTLAATTRFDPAKFSGDWVAVSTLPESERAAVMRFDLGSKESGGFLTSKRNGPDDVVLFSPFTAHVSQPGVLEVSWTSGGAARWVVMWVDETYSTAALGWMDGRRAYILTRPGKRRGDQIAAAREILAFNGWEVSKLRTNE